MFYIYLVNQQTYILFTINNDVKIDDLRKDIEVVHRVYCVVSSYQPGTYHYSPLFRVYDFLRKFLVVHSSFL